MIEDLEIKFRKLRSDMQAEFDKDESITRDKVLDKITDLPTRYKDEYSMYLKDNEQRLEKAESIREIFRILNRELSFMDLGVIENLIKELGSDDLKKQLSSYKKELRRFLRKTTLKHVIQSEQWIGMLKLDLPDGFIALKAEVNEDSSSYNLEKLDAMRRRICGKLRLSETLVYLKGAQEYRSFLVTFIIPAILYKVVTEAVNNLDICFVLREQIRSIVVGNKTFVPQDDRSRGVMVNIM